ncbi:DUF1456 family protein [Bacillus sp. FJAT-42376]|uniref:DUF1456 family protein n=1 Tax=Bacillus sp. FJAT-42376 TaxID=2014076 RepID=UPI000F4FEACE|nr:DUF1456 family protein [Bacillus sp. FJAT-42376]AZB44696.1 DUF1456 family protein [Bacillus sp. FJAT-42376]
MDNNDRLIRLRYALDLRNSEVEEIFGYGGVEVSREDVRKILTKSNEDDVYEENEDHIPCSPFMFESFLNGLIVFKRGKQEGQPGRPEMTLGHPNNVLLKKVKIALSFTAEDMLEVLELAGVTVTKGELGALLRKEGHKNYKECGDKYARNFLKGLAIKFRE